MTESNAKSFSRSTIWFNSQLDAVLEKMKRYSVTFIQGRRGSGKTSFLDQLRFRLTEQGFESHLIQLVSPKEVPLLLLDILKKTGNAPPQSHWPRDNWQKENWIDPSYLQEKFLEIIDKKKSVLMIDGLGLVRDAEPWLQFLIRSVKQGQIVLSCEVAPKLPPIDRFDSFHFSFPGFSREQSDELLSLSEIEWVPGKEEASRKWFYETSQGNPFLLKSLLALHASRSQPIEPESNLESATEAKRHYFEMVSKGLEPGTLRILSQISLIRFDENLIAQFLKDILPRDSELLLQYGMVSRLGKSSQLSADFSRYLRDLLKPSETAELRALLLEKLKAASDYSSVKETFFQKTELGQLPQAAQDFVSLGPEMYQRIDLKDFLDFSDRLKEHIDSPNVINRARVLSIANQRETALQELLDLERREKRRIPEKVAEELSILMIEIQFQLGLFDEALERADELLARAKNGTDLYAVAQVEKANLIRQKDPGSSLSLLEEAQAHFQAIGRADRRLADTYFYLGRAYEMQAQLPDAQKAYETAVSLYKKLHLLYDETVSRYNVLTIRYNLEGPREVLPRLEELAQVSQRHSFERLLPAIQIFLATHLLGQGRFRETLEILNPLSSEIARKKTLSNFETLILRRLAECYFSQGAYSNALEVTERLLLTTSIKRDVPLKTLLEFQARWLQLVLTRRLPKRVQSRQIEDWEKLTQFHQMSLASFILELTLHQGFPVELSHSIRSLDLSQMDSPHLELLLRYRCLNALYTWHVTGSSNGVELLEESLKAAQRFDFKIWETRCLLALAEIDLCEGRISEGSEKINRVEHLQAAFDPAPEFEIRKIVAAMLLLKSGNHAQAIQWLSGVRDNDPIAYLRNRLNAWASSSFLKPMTPLPESVKRRFDLLLSRGARSTVSKVQVQTQNGRSEAFTEELPSLQSGKWDVWINETDGSIQVNRKKAPLSGKGVLQNLFRFLVKHNGRFFTKEELATFVWHEKYNPLAHDTRIYTSMKRLREVLTKVGAGSWLLMQSGTYALKGGLRYCVIQTFDELAALSDRHRWILEFVKANGVINRTLLARLQNISPSLAKLDLKQLADRNFLKKVGSARSTQYRLAHE